MGLCECAAPRDCRLHSQQHVLCRTALEEGGGLATNMSATMKNDKVLVVPRQAKTGY